MRLALVPGDDNRDPERAQLSTLGPQQVRRVGRYLAEGGPANADNLLRYAGSLSGCEERGGEPAPVLRAGMYWPNRARRSLDEITSLRRGIGGVAPVVFYRALVQSGNTAPVDALVEALSARRLRPLPIFLQSLKDGESAALIGELFAAAPPAVILNATGFSVGAGDPLAKADCPILQVVFAGGDEESWRSGNPGLRSRDLALYVAAPGDGGRLLPRPGPFKGPHARAPESAAAPPR